MLTLTVIRDNRDEVIRRLAKKKFTNTSLIDQIIALDDQRRALQVQSDQLQAESNRLSKEIGILIKNGNPAGAQQAKERTARIKEEVKGLLDQMDEVTARLQELLVQIPNLPHDSVPEGDGAESNLKVKEGGLMPVLPESALPHWELGKKYNIIDFETGTKLTGAGFPLFRAKGARLERALINFFLDEAIKAGYQEVLPPLMVNEDSAFATGQLPDKEGQMYHVPIDNLYLIPTAEVPVTNIFRDVILEADELPVKTVAYSPCFRREAGSYGKDVRGLNRVHQFDKVEIVQIAHPDKSYKALDEMVAHVEMLVKKLQLPYRIMRLCGGDMSFTSALTYDFEVYAGAQKKWLEVSSVSNFESFQANRLKLRFRENGSKKTQLAHTLNGSALALPRIVAAILENNQSDRGIAVPAVLIPYTGFEWID
ncbi:MAG: serine--tRNA ligase [Bacteroidales bacterium]|nr:serine--tRNA ligase [Bacteroidales bacterium]